MAHLAVVGSPLGQRRGRAAHRAPQAATLLPRLRRAVPGALQQQDQRRHAAPLAAAVATRAWPTLITETHRRRLDHATSTQLRELEPLADDADFRATLRARSSAPTRSRSRELRPAPAAASTLDPDSLFDVQVKRLHEYKRQLLNVAAHHARSTCALKREPGARRCRARSSSAPRPRRATRMAKLIIKLINAVADVVNGDPGSTAGSRWSSCRTTACRWPSGSSRPPISREQISTAGTEASGTGNMKFALNGALTIGTLDGANIEIREEVGAENFFLFGLHRRRGGRDQAPRLRPGRLYEENQELRDVIDLIASGFFSPDQPRLFRPLVDSLCSRRDEYMLLADFAAYVEAQERVARAYLDPEAWTRMAILNVARMGKFSLRPHHPGVRPRHLASHRRPGPEGSGAREVVVSRPSSPAASRPSHPSRRARPARARSTRRRSDAPARRGRCVAARPCPCRG